MAKIAPWWFSELSQSISYVFIKQGEGELFKSKKFYDLAAPSAIALTVTLVDLFSPGQRSFFSADGFFPKIIPFLGILAAFYIAALTAVASIPSAWLDADMRGPEVTLSGKTVNRRQFVLSLFSYLATAAFLMTVAILFVELFHGAAGELLGDNTYRIMRSILIFSFMFVFLNIIITSVIGVIFISDRIQTPTEQ